MMNNGYKFPCFYLFLILDMNIVSVEIVVVVVGPPPAVFIYAFAFPHASGFSGSYIAAKFTSHKQPICHLIMV